MGTRNRKDSMKQQQTDPALSPAPAIVANLQVDKKCSSNNGV